jgi:oligosaccharyltransferase complex subunit gamma
MAQLLKVLLLLIALVFSQTDKTKLEQLLEIQGEKDYVRLTPALFKKFVQNQSRNYLIVVYFTTFIYESQCEGCVKLNPIFKRLAYSYKESNAFEPAMTEDEKLKPVIFAALEYSQESVEILQKFQFQGLPNLFISSKPFTEEGFFYNVDRSKILSYKEGKEYNEEKVLKYLNEKTGRKVEIKVPMSEYLKIFVFYSTIITLTILFIRSLIYHLFNPKFWWVLSMMVYIVCLGGVVYDIIHGAPLGESDPETGDLSLFAQGPREQYVVEGFLMAGVISLSGVGLIIVNLAGYIEGKWIIRLVSLIGIALWVACGYYSDLIYRKKAEWYNPTFQPPEGYLKGSLMSDQGNSL